MRTDENGLNDRQRKFASLIVKGLTATEAYKKAFSRCKAQASAEVHGCELLKNGRVADYIQKLRAEDNAKLAMDRVVTKQELLEFLTTIIRTLPDLSKVTIRSARASRRRSRKDSAATRSGCPTS